MFAIIQKMKKKIDAIFYLSKTNRLQSDYIGKTNENTIRTIWWVTAFFSFHFDHQPNCIFHDPLSQNCLYRLTKSIVPDSKETDRFSGEKLFQFISKWMSWRARGKKTNSRIQTHTHNKNLLVWMIALYTIVLSIKHLRKREMKKESKSKNHAE